MGSELEREGSLSLFLRMAEMTACLYTDRNDSYEREQLMMCERGE